MRYAFLIFLYLASQLSFAGSVVNEQFHDSSNEGITVYNESFYPVTIYSRFLIPGLQPEAFRYSSRGHQWCLLGQPGSQVS